MASKIMAKRICKRGEDIPHRRSALLHIAPLLLAICFLAPSASCAQDMKAFRLPSPTLLSKDAPLHYSDSRRVMVFFKTTQEAIRKLVPEPLTPNPNHIMGLMVCHWNAKGFQNSEYNDAGGKILEVALITPVRLDKRSGAYIVMFYLDNASRIPMSREIWGFPKKLADVAFDETEKSFSSTVTIGDATILKLHFERTEKVDPAPPSPPGYVFSLKKIPSIRRNAPPEVLQITATMTDFKVKDFWKGKATLAFGPHATEPLGEIPILKILSANDSIIEGTMDYGDVLHDYLAKEKN